MPPTTDWPSVSVVVATRDRPQLLVKAVGAALDQHYPGEIEVLVVFDQTEPEFQACAPARGRRVAVLSNDRTPGLPGARNTGITAASGELIAFCDDDDFWLTGKLITQVTAMRRLDCRAAVTGIQIRYGAELRFRTFAADRLQFVDLIRDRVTAAHPSTYLAERAYVLEQSGLVDEEIPGGYGEDYDWLLRVARGSDIAVCKDALVEVLWHPGSFYTRRWATMVEALDYVVKKHPELAQDRRGLARIRGQQAFALAALGQRRSAWRKCFETARNNVVEKRLLATAAVLLGVVSADRILHMANRLGRGI